jgi:hypothetical protein
VIVKQKKKKSAANYYWEGRGREGGGGIWGRESEPKGGAREKDGRVGGWRGGGASRESEGVRVGWWWWGAR